MMGHREKLKGALEYDALTRAKRFYAFRPGLRKWVKAKANRRARRTKIDV